MTNPEKITTPTPPPRPGTALVLHGGGGPFTVQGLATHLEQRHHVLAPTLPGWDGTELPEHMTSVGDLAAAYLDTLKSQDLRDVLVVGSSLGGWIGLEMALRDADHRIAGLVLIDSAGVAMEGEPIRDIFTLTPRELAEYSFHDAERFFVDPATLPAGVLAARQANMATMKLLAGDPYMHDPGLLARLGDVRVPTLVLWGEADRVVTPGYGRRLAAAIPGARFALVPRAGHLPQIEQAEATCAEIDAFQSSLRISGPFHAHAGTSA
jgi:pimeloyl-ACP methyl ester carboxylesterase